MSCAYYSSNQITCINFNYLVKLNLMNQIKSLASNVIHTLGPGIQMTDSVDFLINRHNSKVRPKGNFIWSFYIIWTKFYRHSDQLKERDFQKIVLKKVIGIFMKRKQIFLLRLLFRFFFYKNAFYIAVLYSYIAQIVY